MPNRDDLFGKGAAAAAEPTSIDHDDVDPLPGTRSSRKIPDDEDGLVHRVAPPDPQPAVSPQLDPKRAGHLGNDTLDRPERSSGKRSAGHNASNPVARDGAVEREPRHLDVGRPGAAHPETALRVGQGALERLGGVDDGKKVPFDPSDQSGVSQRPQLLSHLPS